MTGRLQAASRRLFETGDRTDERWSLVECGIRDEDWNKICEWARRCSASCPSSRSWMGGLALLMVSAAVSRTIEMDEPLWQKVADIMSPRLRLELFGTGSYPVEEARAALIAVAKGLKLREQLDLPGKHRYWRTIQLQVGFSGNTAAARLPHWLAGQGLPEAVKTLIAESDENGSESFRAMWRALRRWSRDPSNRDIEKSLVLNPWYPLAQHEQLKHALATARENGIGTEIGEEAAESAATMLAGARLCGESLEMDLSTYLPSEITGAQVLRMNLEGTGLMYKLGLNAEGDRVLEDGPVRLAVRDALERPRRDLRVLSAAGTIYKERVELWPQDEEVIVYDARSGRQIHDLARFRPVAGHPYALIAAADVRLLDASGEVCCVDRSEAWCLYRFPQGFSKGLEVRIDGNVSWVPEPRDAAESSLPGLSCHVRELSLTHLAITVLPPPGWTVEAFRFAGKRIAGGKGEVVAAPTRRDGRLVRVSLAKDAERLSALTKAERAGEEATGAAYEDPERGWVLVPRDKVLDAGLIEGRTLAVRWSETEADDPWLTLGCVPIVANPRNVRRQRYAACGEPLELRFGLMNEVSNFRVTLAAAVCATGLLAAVRTVDGHYVLALREAIEAVDELRVWVWEEGKAQPRLLDDTSVRPYADKQSLLVSEEAVGSPLGWAIALDGDWRGARFHCEPHAREWPIYAEKWLRILSTAEMWADCARSLGWWRFPMLMEPFRTAVEEQANRFGLLTLKAWIDLRRRDGEAVPRASADFLLNPVRTFLWNYRPTPLEATELWEVFENEVMEGFTQRKLSPASALLLHAHPVLLARLVCETLWTHHQRMEAELPRVRTSYAASRSPDPARAAMLDREFQALFSAARELIERHASLGQDPGKRKEAVLRAEALSDLKSWTDSRSLDAGFFEEHILRPAESLFEGVAAQTARLQIAVARSRACAALIAVDLLNKKGFKVNR